MCFIAVNCNQFAFSCKGDYTRSGCKLQEEFAKSLHFCFWENENALSVKAAGLASSPFGRGGSAFTLTERAIHFRSDLGQDRITHGGAAQAGAAFAHVVCRTQALVQHLVHSVLNGIGFLSHAKGVAQHHGGREDAGGVAKSLGT